MGEVLAFPRALLALQDDRVEALVVDFSGERRVETVSVFVDALAEARNLRSIAFAAAHFLDDERCEAIAEALRKNKNVVAVDLGGTECGAAGAASLGRGMESGEVRFASLNLRSTRVGPEGAIHLAKGIEKSTTLRELNLSRCSISSEGVVALGRALAISSTLETMDLSRNRIATEGAEALGEGIAMSTSLKTLNLSTTYLDVRATELVLRGVERSRSLISLNLSSNKIGDANGALLMEALRRCTTLRSLDLYGCALTAEWAARTRGAEDLERITSLNLACNEILGEGAKLIGEVMRSPSSSRMVELDLSGCNIDHEGAEVLAEGLRRCRTLTRLSLALNAVGGVGARALASAIREHANMKEVNLSHNKISAEAAPALGLCLASNRTLQKFSIAGNPMGDESAAAIGEGIGKSETLREVDLEQVKIGPRGGHAIAEAISRSKSLSMLRLNCNGKLGADAANEILRAIAKSPTMTRIELADCELDSAVVDSLVYCIKNSPSLVSCDLCRNSLRADTPTTMSAVWRAFADNFRFESLVLEDFRPIAEVVRGKRLRRRHFKFILQTSSVLPAVVTGEPKLVEMLCDYFEFCEVSGS